MVYRSNCGVQPKPEDRGGSVVTTSPISLTCECFRTARRRVSILNNAAVLAVTLDQSHARCFSLTSTKDPVLMCEFLSGAALLTPRLFLEVLSPSAPPPSRCRLQQRVQFRERGASVRQQRDVAGRLLGGLSSSAGRRRRQRLPEQKLRAGLGADRGGSLPEEAPGVEGRLRRGVTIRNALLQDSLRFPGQNMSKPRLSTAEF